MEQHYLFMEQMVSFLIHLITDVLMIADIVIDSDNEVIGVRFRQGGSFRSSNYDFSLSKRAK